MPNTIRHKRGTTTPAAASLVTGEIAINTASGVAFTKTDAGAVVSLGGLSTADLGNGNATAGALVLAALQNANAPSATNQFATEGDLNSAVTAFSAQIGACRAWVNFNGTGTVAIRAALNVSSITDNGVGDYTVNFTTAMPDVNYSFCGLAKELDTIAAGSVTLMGAYGATLANSVATGFLRVSTQAGATKYDCVSVSISIFR